MQEAAILEPKTHVVGNTANEDFDIAGPTATSALYRQPQNTRSNDKSWFNI